MGAGKPGRGAALGLAVFRVKLAVKFGESEGNLRGISGSAGAGTGAGKSAGEQIHGGPTARPAEMAHAPRERVRAVLLGELLRDDPFEVPLVVGEALDGVLRAHLAVADAEQSPSESANGVRGNAPPCG